LNLWWKRFNVVNHPNEALNRNQREEKIVCQWK
jgi:hypothetical protein